jgi:Leucine-rich repeat (LRR) protein
VKKILLKNKCKQFAYTLFTYLILHSSISHGSDFLHSIAIKDDALKQCINDLSIQHQWKNIHDIHVIKCHSKGIKSIEGLPAFANLTTLSLFNNKIKVIDLRAFNKLEVVNISNNKLTHIQLEQLSNLHTLYLFKNQLQTINFSGLTKLNKLRITNNKLNHIDISPLISLEKAYFFDNQLEDLIVKNLPKLSFIELRQNPMPDEVYDRYDAIEGVTIIHDGNADDWQ